MKVSRDMWVKLIVVVICLISAILLMAFIAEQFWVLVLLPFFILPGFRLIGWLEDLDERARRHTEQSNSIAFLAVLCMLMVLELDSYLAGEQIHQNWLGLIILGVLTKLFAYAAMNFRPRTSGFAIGLLCGTFWIWFAVASNWGDIVAVIIQSIFGIVILFGTFIGRRWPVQGAMILLMLALALTFFPIMNVIDRGRLSTGVFLLILLSLPPALSGGFYLYDHFSYEQEGK